MTDAVADEEMTDSEQPEIQNLDVDLFVSSDAVQSRDGLDPDTVAQYVADMEAGSVFPPLTAFFDGERYWLGAGFHRLAAHRRIGHKQVATIVRPGGEREAYLENLRSNLTHGLPLKNSERRKNVMRLLGDQEWAQRSNRWIARATGISDHTVEKLRKQLEQCVAAGMCNPDGSRVDDSEYRTGEDGKRYPVNRKSGAQNAHLEPAPSWMVEDRPEPAEPVIAETCQRPNEPVSLQFTRIFAFFNGLTNQYGAVANMFNTPNWSAVTVNERRDLANAEIMAFEAFRAWHTDFRVYAELSGLLPQE